MPKRLPPDHVAARHGRDLAVVDDLDGDAAELVLGDVVEDRHHPLLVDVWWDVRKAVAPRGLAVRRYRPRGAAADGNDGPRQCTGRLLHGLDDEVVVVLRVRVGY